MRVNPHQFKAFAHVVREGSISSAARKLGVSQSAVTQHVSKLESAVGARLFVRGRDGIVLTRAGQEFFELADRYVTLETMIDEKLQGYADLNHGQLKIIANAPQPALRLIARYSAQFPEVEVDLTLFDWTTAMNLLQTRQVDIAIVTDPTRKDEWYRRKITDARYVLYARSDHPLASQRTVSLAEVAQEVVLLPEQGSLTHRIVSKALKQRGLSLRRLVRTTTFPVMKEAILQGVGIGVFLENSAVEEKRLVELPIIDLPESYETCLIVPKYKLDLRLIQSFVAQTD
ncbi:MAG: LysR family transcriptional regulator [Kiloniellales bacterium]